MLENGPPNTPKHPTPEQSIEKARNIILLKTLFITAFRISECLSLKQNNFEFNSEQDFDVIRNVINLKQRKDSDFAIKNDLWIPKTDPLMIDIRRAVKALPYPEAHLFPRRKMVWGWCAELDYDRHITRQWCMNICKTYNPNLHPHVLRHSRIVELVNVYNLDIIPLQAFSSHSSLQTLQHYIQTSPRLYADRLAKINA